MRIGEEAASGTLGERSAVSGIIHAVQLYEMRCMRCAGKRDGLPKAQSNGPIGPQRPQNFNTYAWLED